MKDIEIIKQLLSGNHLEKDEIKRAKEIVEKLRNELKDRS